MNAGQITTLKLYRQEVIENLLKINGKKEERHKQTKPICIWEGTTNKGFIAASTAPWSSMHSCSCKPRCHPFTGSFLPQWSTLPRADLLEL